VKPVSTVIGREYANEPSTGERAEAATEIARKRDLTRAFSLVRECDNVTRLA
jgi:hypothetical protein